MSHGAQDLDNLLEELRCCLGSRMAELEVTSQQKRRQPMRSAIVWLRWHLKDEGSFCHDWLGQEGSLSAVVGILGSLLWSASRVRCAGMPGPGVDA